MNRAAQIREVYAELRRALGGSISELEALEHAAALVELFTLDEEEGCDLRTGGLPFEQWALDSAFADGGWRVLGHEPQFLRGIAEEEEHEQLMYLDFKKFNEEGVSL